MKKMMSYFLMLIFIIPLAMGDEKVEMSYTYGAFVSLSGDNLIISEYNFETSETSQTPYQLAKDLTLQNIENISALKAGMNLDVGFLIQDGIKVAKVLSLSQKS